MYAHLSSFFSRFDFTHTAPPVHTHKLQISFVYFQYLGDLERVSGNSYLEPNRNYEMPIMTHTSLVYPGEILPMILSQHVFLSADFNDDGLIFGLICRELQDSHSSKVFGVTCQIFERSNDNSDDITIKSRAYQRFYVKNQWVLLHICVTRIYLANSFSMFLFFFFQGFYYPKSHTICNRYNSTRNRTLTPNFWPWLEQFVEISAKRIPQKQIIETPK